MSDEGALLEGVRVVESSMLGPAGLAMHLADLGADVVKVEAPGGDYVRQMAWPIVDGVSQLHWHLNRGKRSIVLDLRVPEAVEAYLDLVRVSDVVIEAMRPGALARRGLDWDTLRAANPRIVQCTISGYGATGPYAGLASHGIAYDAWAGVAPPQRVDGFPAIPDHTSIGINAGPLYGALGVLAGVVRARATGEGCRMEVAQSDAAAAVNWLPIETEKAYERPEDEVTGNDGSGHGPRRAAGTAGMADAVRYQYYDSADGTVLFMASERKFWQSFCDGVGRPDLFASHPGAEYADHARGDVALRRELTAIFATRTTEEWVRFGAEVNTPIAPANTARSIATDPQFRARLGFLPHEAHGSDLLPSPIRPVDGSRPVPTRAPAPGQHTDEVLRDVLGYDDATVHTLRTAGALGPRDDA